MHPNLMSTSGARNRSKDAELIAGRCRFSEAPLNKEFRLCWRALNVNDLFEPDHRMLVFALAIQRSVNKFVFPRGPAPNDREIFLVQRVSLHQKPKLPCC